MAKKGSWKSLASGAKSVKAAAKTRYSGGRHKTRRAGK